MTKNENLSLSEPETDGAYLIIAESADHELTNLWSLVLFSADIPHHIQPAENGHQLLVKAPFAEKAWNEIAAFKEENSDWPQPQNIARSIAIKGSAQPPTVPLVVALIVFHQITGPWAWNSDWFELGAASRIEIVQKFEWWRLATALTLHADAAHLLGNCLIGGTIVHLLCLEVGTGMGWSLIFVSGMVGNLLNALMRSGQHLSVGFSTTVFGAVGALCGLRAMRRHGVKNILAPLGAGAGLLAMLGSSGERTDLGAHFWGFLVGLILAGILSLPPSLEKWSSNRAFKLLPIFWVAFFILCWRVAFHFH